jgi:hypothetical protein
MESLADTLYERVDQLIRSHKGQEPHLSTIGTRGLVDVLVARTEGLEQAVREITREVEKLAASQKGRSAAAEL